MSLVEKGRKRISPALMTGSMTLAIALILGIWQPEWSLLPPVIFIVICLVAPFFPGVGFFLPVISRGKAGGTAVALTFDDGPDPETTRPLLSLLKRHNVRAAFFVTGENALAHGELIRAILEQGHEIGNHSFHHDPFLMLHRSKTVRQEIESTQKLLDNFGITPLAFRPPVGITNPKLARILPEQGLFCLNFSCRGNDFGNRRVQGLARRILTKVKPNDIVLLHDVRPPAATVDEWLREIEQVLTGMKSKSLQPIPLSDLIGRPVMKRAGSGHNI